MTHLQREPIDLALARRQHAEYEQALREAGCEIRQIPEQPDWPDSVFVEDTAIVLDEVAVAMRPGAPSRRGEVASVADALAAFRDMVTIETPATIDGGDVLRLGKRLYVGASSRSNRDGVAQLERLLAPFGYRVEAVAIEGCLHLKSAVTRIADDLLLVNPERVDAGAFPGWRSIACDPAEPDAANALRIGDRLILSESWPRTATRLRQAGIDVHAVAMSEMEKAEGAVTCCSLIVEHRAG
ncbi:MAG TPA: arginine deiminase-related protein [Rhodanobacteraceae bacterium]|nr:arginine deiminase-related protein [Rhodanobacteraceae bacterium]